MRRLRTTAARCVLLAAVVAAAPAAARAATTWTVNTTVDASPPGCLSTGPCSIRQALAAASAGDTIVIPASASHYTLSLGQQLAVTNGVTIQGAGQASTIIDAGGTSRVMNIDTAPGATTALSGLTLTGGSLTNSAPPAGGGGIDLHRGALSLNGVSVSGNSVTSGEGGGGIFDDSTETLALTDSTVNSNEVSISGGGLGGGGILAAGGPLVLSDSSVNGNSLTLSGQSAGFAGGGGIYDAGTGATITASTIAANTATIAGTGGSDGGGAIYDQAGPSTYLNDTLSANSVTLFSQGSSGGGGALFHNGSPGSISDTTIAGNATNQAGGAVYNNSGTYTLKNTIVADNGSSCAGPGTISSAGFNLEGSDLCHLTMPSDRTHTEPQLGPLTGNGGPTLTQALSPASPALDAGSCTDASGNPVSTDQRGLARPQPLGGKCDIGAFEYAAASAVPLIVGGSRPEVNGSRSADFSGLVNPGGLPSTAHFDYGLDARYRPAGVAGTVYDRSTPAARVGSGYAPAVASASVSGLVPAALYHVRLVAANSAGRALGPDQTFVTAEDRAPPRPALGRSVNLAAIGGLVRVLIGKTFVPLTEVRQLPSGVEIDARQGTVQVSAAGANGNMTGTFSGAVFKLSQVAAGPNRGLITVSLADGAFSGVPAYTGCQKSKHASSVLQTLRAAVAGYFRIGGRYSAGSARAGQWATSDRCDGTLTAVQRGPVLVSNFARHLTVTVRGGHRYLARAPASRRAHRGLRRASDQSLQLAFERAVADLAHL